MDRMVRRRGEDAPFIPGTTIRFEWAEDRWHDTRMVRERVQEGAPGLFVLRVPGTPFVTLAECYYPDEMQEATWNMMDPARRSDWQDGRLVCIATVPVHGSFRIGGGRKGSVNAIREVTDSMVEEIRKNNRSANSTLKRTSTAGNRKRALENEEEAIFDAASQEFADFYAEAYLETQKFAMGKPRVSMYSPSEK